MTIAHTHKRIDKIRIQKKMSYELPKLSYSYDALEPHIDSKTMEIHHTKHHQTYVTKLNEALATVNLESPCNVRKLLRHIQDLPESVKGAVRNHAGGHANHSLFWEIIAPGCDKTAPEGELVEAINASFGSFENFKKNSVIYQQHTLEVVGHF